MPSSSTRVRARGSTSIAHGRRNSTTRQQPPTVFFTSARHRPPESGIAPYRLPGSSTLMAWSRTSSPGKRAFETSAQWTRSVRTSGAFTRIVAVRALRAILSLSLFAQLLLPATALPTFASSVSSASFTGGAGTATVGGTLYAKSGGALTLTVTTSNDTKCVEVSGAHAARQTSSTAKSSWTFSFTARTGDGAQAVTAAASPNFNANNCTGQTGSAQAPYMLDNTGPTVTAVLSPAAPPRPRTANPRLRSAPRRPRLQPTDWATPVRVRSRSRWTK